MSNDALTKRYSWPCGWDSGVVCDAVEQPKLFGSLFASGECVQSGPYQGKPVFVEIVCGKPARCVVLDTINKQWTCLPEGTPTIKADSAVVTVQPVEDKYSKCERKIGCFAVCNNVTGLQTLDIANVRAAIAALGKTWDDGTLVSATSADMARISKLSFRVGCIGDKCPGNGGVVCADNQTVEYFPAGTANPSGGCYSANGGGHFTGNGFEDPADEDFLFQISEGGGLWIEYEVDRCFDINGILVPLP